MKTAILTTLAVLGIAYGAAASADTMDMHSIGESPANTASGVPRPDRGLTMDTVRARFGAPSDIVGPVGDPPITRWVFPDYTVYFEHNRVIHSVVHRDQRAATTH